MYAADWEHWLYGWLYSIVVREKKMVKWIEIGNVISKTVETRAVAPSSKQIGEIEEILSSSDKASYDLKRIQVEEFLDYHFSKFKGEKDDFFGFLEEAKHFVNSYELVGVIGDFRISQGNIQIDNWVQKNDNLLIDQRQKKKDGNNSFDFYLSPDGEKYFPEICNYYNGTDQAPKQIAALIWFMKDEGFLNANADFLNRGSYNAKFNDSLVTSLQLLVKKKQDSVKTPVKNLYVSRKSTHSGECKQYADAIKAIGDSLKGIID